MATTPISLSAYARHRKSRGLPGGTLYAVQVAKRDGRIKRSVTRRGKIRSTELADAEWLASTKSEYVPDTGPTSPARNTSPEQTALNPLAEARARREAAQAEIREMELAQRRGELVPAKDIESHLANLFTQCRTRLLSIPARARQHDASLSGPQLVLLERLLREALEDLAASPTEHSGRRAS